MLRVLMSGGGSEIPFEVEAAVLKLQWWLLNTRRMDGLTSTRWCACRGECDLGYSLILGRPGTAITDMPDSSGHVTG
jgi:hypothetical protein